MARQVSLSLDLLLHAFASLPGEWIAMRELAPRLPAGRSTIARRLAEAVTKGLVDVRGKGSSCEYRLAPKRAARLRPEAEARESIIPWSERAEHLLQYVRGPRASRRPISYQESLVGEYIPNVSFWLPEVQRTRLHEIGREEGHRPAGTYARDVLAQLLVDLSWESSRLEGNRYSRLETKALIEAGLMAEGKSRQDAVMILNHKRAIEFLVDSAPHDDPWYLVIANIHAQLMDGLLKNEDGLGRIRNRIVTIDGSVYTPWQAPHALERMYRMVCEKAQSIQDPLEASFFLFTQLPYLQPFEDGNKRTARVSCNLPLTRANYAPLAFLDVAEDDYFGALLALYEKADPSAACDLFEWAYERSVRSYRTVKEAMGEPDPFRVRLREALSEAVRRVVIDDLGPGDATASLGLDSEDIDRFETMLRRELDTLAEYNYARYGLRLSQIRPWLEKNR